MNASVNRSEKTVNTNYYHVATNGSPTRPFWQPMNASRIDFSKCDECSKTETLKKCSRCHSAIYCGTECQTAAWPKHKNVCQAISKGARCNAVTKYRLALGGGGVIEVVQNAEVVIGSSLTTKVNLRFNVCQFDFTNLTNDPRFDELKGNGQEEIKDLPRISREIEQWIEIKSKGLVGCQASMSIIMELHNFVRPIFQDESTPETFKISQKTFYKMIRNTKVCHMIAQYPLPIENVVQSWKIALKNNLATYAEILKAPLTELKGQIPQTKESKISEILAQQVLAKIMRICIVLFPTSTPPSTDISTALVHANGCWDLYRPQDQLNQIHDVYDEIILEAELSIKASLNIMSGGNLRTMDNRVTSPEDEITIDLAELETID